MDLRRLARLVALSVLVVTAATQPVFLLGAGFVTISRELDLTPTSLGALTSAFFLTAGLASPMLGGIVQRRGWRRAMLVNMAGTAMVLVAIAVMARDVVTFGLLLVVGGAFYGLANPAANQALADFVVPRHRALVFGLKHAGIPASTLLAGLAVPLVIVDLGWRPAYLMALALVVIVVSLVPRTDPRPTAPTPSHAVGSAPLARRSLLGLGLGASLATWAPVVLSSYLVAAAVDRGFSEEAGGLLLFAGSAASIGARVIAGYITDRVRGRGFGALAIVTGVGALVFVGLAYASGAWFVALVPLAFATGWGWPGLMTFTVVNANTGSAAASTGLTQAGIFLGAGFGPLVVGLLVETWGFRAAFLLVAVLLASASAVVTAIGRGARHAGVTSPAGSAGGAASR